MKTTDTNNHRLEALFREALTPKPTTTDTEQAWQVLVCKHRKQCTYRIIYVSIASVAAILTAVFILRTTLPNEILTDIQVFASLDAPNEVSIIEKDGHTIATTPAGRTTTLLLSDSTEVLLSANSRLEYPTRFMGNVREVTLSGEARFHVTRHEGKSFIVRAAGLDTEVFGTVFDVRAYPQTTPDVALYEGCISVNYQGEGLRMEPGQQVLIDAEGTLQLTTIMAHRGSWANGYFEFDDQDLRTVMQEIGVWYNISVTFESPHLLDQRIHFRFSRQHTIDTILQVLNDIGIAQFTMDRDEIKVISQM